VTGEFIFELDSDNQLKRNGGSIYLTNNSNRGREYHMCKCLLVIKDVFGIALEQNFRRELDKSLSKTSTLELKTPWSF
jgi:hypothetical protein